MLADQEVAAAACQALQMEAPVPVEAVCAGIDLLGLVAQDSKGCSILSGMTARMRHGLSNMLQVSSFADKGPVQGTLNMTRMITDDFDFAWVCLRDCRLWWSLSAAATKKAR